MPVKLFTIIIGVILVCFGCALYIAADIGIVPYDAVAYIIELKTNGIPFYKSALEKEKTFGEVNNE